MKFEVFAISNSGKRVGPSVFVNAADVKRAQDAGKYWLRVIGHRARYVRAVPYHPERDPAISMYVRKVGSL